MERQRRESRFKASFPVEIEPKGGVLVDMSGSGIAFETDHSDYKIGDEIQLRIRVGQGKSFDLECIGRVVRIEQREDTILVAATVEWREDENMTATII